MPAPRKRSRSQQIEGMLEAMAAFLSLAPHPKAWRHKRNRTKEPIPLPALWAASWFEGLDSFEPAITETELGFTRGAFLDAHARWEAEMRAMVAKIRAGELTIPDDLIPPDDGKRPPKIDRPIRPAVDAQPPGGDTDPGDGV